MGEFAQEVRVAKIAFIGGTGPEGLGLAMRLGMAGHAVRIGSRRVERAEEAAATVRDAVAAAGGSADVDGGVNAEVVGAAEIVVVVVPFDGHEATLQDLREPIGEKLVIDAAVPLIFNDGVPGVVEVAEGSATEQAQVLLPQATVIGAFHNLSARKLQALDTPMDGDVLVTGDDEAGKATVMELVQAMPALRPVDAGPLAMSKFVEDLTALILGINRRYKAQAAVRMVGVDDGNG